MNSNIIPGIASLFEEYERLRIEGKFPVHKLLFSFL